MNSYKDFREGLMRVIKLENFMGFFDRDGDCCSAATGIKKKLSGYYEGQWKLLDSSPGLQAFLSEEQENKPINSETNSFRRTNWYTNYIGHEKLSEDYIKWQLEKLGHDFVSRGYSKGKANFAILFDEIIQDNGMSN